MRAFALVFALALPFFGGAFAQDSVATLRGAAALAEQGEAPPMTKIKNTDIRPPRNYPEQPPTIPHSIRDYQIDTSANKCMSCHGRRAVEDSQAPMVSITHFMSRDGQFLATISPRRYFCTQCHVPQHLAKPLVANDFVDMDDLVGKGVDGRGRR